MTISEIQSLDEKTVKEMAKEAISIKGHTVYFVYLGSFFGYSALVFCDGRHIYYANDYALHHEEMKYDEHALRGWYVNAMNRKLFTEDELRTPSDRYSELDAKKDFLHNYYPMRREYQTIFCKVEDAAEWYKRDKESAIFSNIAFAYFKPEDRKFVEHLHELYKAFNACNNPLRDYKHAKDAFRFQMFNHEYPINGQGDYDVISCFTKVSYKGDGTEIEQTGWSDEIKRAYLDARREVIRSFNY